MVSTRINFKGLLGPSPADKRLDILRSMQQVGSISGAARANGVSYKAAWQALETLNNLAGIPLVDKAVGGVGGGGAKLTAAGIEVLEAAHLVQTARAQALAQIAAFGQASVVKLPNITAAMGLRTSMRNQLPCQITRIRTSGETVALTLALTDDQTLHASITRESLQLLDLHQGQGVLAMCKATAVSVAPHFTRDANVNHLQGKVLRRDPRATGTEVSLQLNADLVLVGFADGQTKWRRNQAAIAAISPQAVVIGLPT